MFAHRLRRWSAAALVTVAAACTSARRAPQAAVSAGNVAPTIRAAPDQFFASGDARIRYRQAGRGDDVILVHGLTRSLEDWIGVGDSLALDHHVVALDLRGFGQSTRFKEPRQLGAETAEDVVRLLDHLGIRRAHMAGHSYGALIVANVAARHPERVATASLIAGPFYNDAVRVSEGVAPWVADLERGAGMRKFLQWLFPGMPDTIAAAGNAQIMATNDPATIAATMRAMTDLVVGRERAAAISAPTLVTVGTGDALLENSRWVASWWPRARLLELRGVDHGAIVSRPEVLAAMRALMRPGAQ